MREEGLGHMQRAVKVDLEYPFNRRVIEIYQPDKRLNNSGVIDDAIYRSKVSDDLVGQRFNSLSLCYVCDVPFEPLGTKLALLRGRFKCFRV
jgi:hypothetical protein